MAWLYGEGVEGMENGFELKEKDAEEWQPVDVSYITANGGSFTARVPHLKAGTSYVCRAYSGEDKGEEIEFTTGTAVELPNGSFDEWHKVNKVWEPWAEGGNPIWDSGNDGVLQVDRYGAVVIRNDGASYLAVNFSAGNKELDVRIGYIVLNAGAQESGH